jgi:hypothetical protein
MVERGVQYLFRAGHNRGGRLAHVEVLDVAAPEDDVPEDLLRCRDGIVHHPVLGAKAQDCRGETCQLGARDCWRERGFSPFWRYTSDSFVSIPYRMPS